MIKTLSLPINCIFLCHEVDQWNIPSHFPENRWPIQTYRIKNYLFRNGSKEGRMGTIVTKSVLESSKIKQSYEISPVIIIYSINF